VTVRRPLRSCNHPHIQRAGPTVFIHLLQKFDTLAGQEAVEPAKFTDVNEHVTAAILRDESEFSVIDPGLKPARASCLVLS
jgi:hypothetical protein